LVPVTSQYCIKLKYAKKFNEYDYGPSGLPLELSSHPHKGIAYLSTYLGATNALKKLGIFFAGIGPKEGSACVIREGNLLQCVKNNDILRSYHKPVNGTAVLWNSADEHAKQNSGWIIRQDGKVSPEQAPHLCLGALPQCGLHLVSRDSQNRLTFEYHLELKESQNNLIPNDKKGIPLTLSSHPNCGVVYRSESPTFEVHNFTVVHLCIGGPSESSALARFSKSKELVLDEHGGIVMFVVGGLLERGRGVIAKRYNCDQPRPGQPFQVNDDGSISPVDAPHIALGFPEIKIPNVECPDEVSSRLTSQTVDSSKERHKNELTKYL